jgi:hypothetical protein
MSRKPGIHTIPIRTLKFVTFVSVAVVSRDLPQKGVLPELGASGLTRLTAG